MSTCQTKYPILLLHGLNCRDEKPVFYWGRIPAALRAQGAAVYLGGQDAWGSIESNAEHIKLQIEKILLKERCDKLNIIAHSKGGLEARYLISSLGMGNRVASLTTISTPHHGAKSVSLWVRLTLLLKPVCCCLNCYWRIMGDKAPDAYTAAHQLTAESATQFNQENPDDPKVYYQSWGSVLNKSKNDLGMSLLRLLFYPADGENDGLVSLESAKWTNYQGTIENLSHQDIVDSRKKNHAHFNAAAFYCELVSGLAEAGF